MRSFLLTTALVAHALTALGAIHRHAHGHPSVNTKQLQRREPELDKEAAELRKREMDELIKRAVDKREATDWNKENFDHDGYKAVSVWNHAALRFIHHIDPEIYEVTWDDEIAKCAQQIASTCVYEHDLSCCPDCGQNIAAGYSALNISATIAELWYNSEVDLFADYYGQPSLALDVFEQVGHMTQIVWKGTSRIGCATAFCPNGLAGTGGGVEPFFSVCNYLEAGNMDTMYADNVPPPRTSWKVDGNTYSLG